MHQTETVSLDNICGGAAKELFDHEMERILANIADINTDADKRRRITLQFDFKPLPDRTGASISFSVNSKPAPVAQVKSTIFLIRKDGKLAAYSADVNQGHLYTEESQEPTKSKFVPTGIYNLRP